MQNLSHRHHYSLQWTNKNNKFFSILLCAKIHRKRKSQEMSDYLTKMQRVEDLDSVDFQGLIEVKKLWKGGFGEVGVSVICIL